MITWEYRVVDFRKPADRSDFTIIQNQMNGYGSQGWEAAAVWQDGTSVYVIFKKPK